MKQICRTIGKYVLYLPAYQMQPFFCTNFKGKYFQCLIMKKISWYSDKEIKNIVWKDLHLNLHHETLRTHLHKNHVKPLLHQKLKLWTTAQPCWGCYQWTEQKITVLVTTDFDSSNIARRCVPKLHVCQNQCHKWKLIWSEYEIVLNVIATDFSFFRLEYKTCRLRNWHFSTNGIWNYCNNIDCCFNNWH